MTAAKTLQRAHRVAHSGRAIPSRGAVIAVFNRSVFPLSPRSARIPNPANTPLSLTSQTAACTSYRLSMFFFDPPHHPPLLPICIYNASKSPMWGAGAAAQQDSKGNGEKPNSNLSMRRRSRKSGWGGSRATAGGRARHRGAGQPLVMPRPIRRRRCCSRNTLLLSALLSWTSPPMFLSLSVTYQQGPHECWALQYVDARVCVVDISLQVCSLPQGWTYCVFMLLCTQRPGLYINFFLKFDAVL